MSHNIAAKDRLERDKINVDLAAAGVAYRERLNLPVIPAQVEHKQPEALRDYFRERLAYYRNLSLKLPGGNDPVYHKEPKD
ncbi:DNA polymerase III subunit theta [Pantoea ananatis]